MSGDVEVVEAVEVGVERSTALGLVEVPGLLAPVDERADQSLFFFADSVAH